LSFGFQFTHCRLGFFCSQKIVPHMDYLDIDKQLEHDYDSSKKGGNRFATILLYMTDLEEKDGGETVFIDAWPTGQREADRKPIDTVRRLKQSEDKPITQKRFSHLLFYFIASYHS
jgi:hypothetical protein